LTDLFDFNFETKVLFTKTNHCGREYDSFS